MSSSFVARTIVHLAGEEVLRALDCDVTVGLVYVDVVLETLVDLLCEADLLLWHQLVWEALRLRALSPLLGLGANDLLSRDGALCGCKVALLLTRTSFLLILIVNIHVVIWVDRALSSALSTSSLHFCCGKVVILDWHLSLVVAGG